MKVKELKEMLEDYDDDQEIIIQDSGNYANKIGYIMDDKGIRAYWGNDFKALVLTMGSQIGAVWELDELDLEEEE